MAILILLFAVYAVSKTMAFMLGPTLEITFPEDGSKVATTTTITGYTKNISSLSLNQKPIFVDTAGVFKERLILPSGYNIIELRAKDKFNRVIIKKLQLINQL